MLFRSCKVSQSRYGHQANKPKDNSWVQQYVDEVNAYHKAQQKPPTRKETLQKELAKKQK